MTYYIIFDNGKYRRIGCQGFTPKGYSYCKRCPDEAEHAADVDIIDGIPVFNAEKKAARIASEKAEENAAELAQKTKREKIDAATKKIKETDFSKDMTTKELVDLLNEIKTILLGE